MTVIAPEHGEIIEPQVTLLHSRSNLVGRQDLLGLPVPEATRTHVPIAHADVVAALVQSLGYRNIEVVKDEYALTPDAMRGRAMAVYSMMFMGLAPIGALLGGALSDRVGAPLTVAIGGLASLAGAWWFSVQLPKIRVEARQLIVAQAMSGGGPSQEMTAPLVED